METIKLKTWIPCSPSYTEIFYWQLMLIEPDSEKHFGGIRRRTINPSNRVYEQILEQSWEKLFSGRAGITTRGVEKKFFRFYLDGQTVTLYAEHQALEPLKKQLPILKTSRTPNNMAWHNSDFWRFSQDKTSRKFSNFFATTERNGVEPKFFYQPAHQKTLLKRQSEN